MLTSKKALTLYVVTRVYPQLYMMFPGQNQYKMNQFKWSVEDKSAYIDLCADSKSLSKFGNSFQINKHYSSMSIREGPSLCF